MTTATPERVQLDRYFYRVITTKQSNPKASVWLLERDGLAPPSTIYDTQRAAKTFDQADEASVVNELSDWAVMRHTNVLPLINIARLTQLLLKLSPLYAQNRGGRVLIQSPAAVLSEVIDPSVHNDIGPTMDYLRDEVKHFLHLMSDAVSLF